jgi:hypothetical protein
MKGGKKMKEYESIDKKVDELFIKHSKKNSNYKNQEMKKIREYKHEREKISQQIMKLKAENKINYI